MLQGLPPQVEHQRRLEVSEVILRRRNPLDVIRYVLQNLEKQAIAAGSYPTLIHEGLEAEEKVRAEVARLEGLILAQRKEGKPLNDWEDVDPYNAGIGGPMDRAQREESTVDLEYMKTVEQAARDGKLGIQRAQREEGK